MMTRETSVHDGRPVELYEFTLGLTVWRFTSADRAIDAHGGVYTPLPIGRTSIQQSDEPTRAGLTLSTTLDNPFVTAFVAGANGRRASLTVYRGHAGAGEAWLVYWSGRVAAVSCRGAQAEIACEHVLTALRRQAPGACFQVLCRHALYSAGCGISAGSYQVTAAVAAVSGATLTVPALVAHPDDWFAAGFLRYGDFVYRTVEGHAGALLALDRPIPNLAVGATIRVFPGCNHSSAHCREKFGNLVNFGGFEFIPLRNPFASLGSNLL